MIIIKPVKIFTVNSRSRSSVGRGTISIDIISRMIKGIPRLAILKPLNVCRKGDNETDSIILPNINELQ